MRANGTKRAHQAMSTVTLGTFIDLYLADMRLKNRTPDSITTNRLHLQRFATHAGGGEVQLGRVTADVVRSYVAAMQARHMRYEHHPTRPPVEGALSPYTIRKTVKILRGFGSWLAREGLANPFDRLDIPTVPKTLVEVLSPAEVTTILAALNPNTANGARNQAFILLMLDSGPRVSEVAGLRLEELDLPNREAKLMGKGRKERRIPFGQKTARALLRYITAFRAEAAKPEFTQVFLTLDGYPLDRNAIGLILRRLRIATGVRKLHAHRLRHTFAVNFLAAGGDLETLRRILGHESLEVTKRYLTGLQAAQVKKLYDDYSPMDRLSGGDPPRRFGPRGVTQHRSDGDRQ